LFEASGLNQDKGGQVVRQAYQQRYFSAYDQICESGTLDSI